MTMGNGADGPIGILIADGYPIFREGFRKTFQDPEDIRIAGESGDGWETLNLVQQADPDVLLMDASITGLSGLEVLRRLKGMDCCVRTILISDSPEAIELGEAVQLGVRGIITREITPEQLVKCVRAVSEGQFWLGQGQVADLIKELVSPEPRAKKNGNGRFALTPRELEVAEKIAAGCTNKDIARELGISEQTVKHHVSSIFDKVGVSTRLELALFAVEHLQGETA